MITGLSFMWPSATWAESFEWLGQTGDWSDSNQWTPDGGPPTAGDSAAVTATGAPYTLFLDISPTVQGFQLNSSDATFASLADERTLAVNGGALDLISGTLSGNPLFDVFDSDLTIGSSTSGDFIVDYVGLQPNRIHGSQLAAGRQLRLSGGVATFSAPVFTNQGTLQLGLRMIADQFQNEGLFEMIGADQRTVETELHNTGIVVVDTDALLVGALIGRAAANHTNQGSIELLDGERVQFSGDSFTNNDGGMISLGLDSEFHARSMTFIVEGGTVAASPGGSIRSSGGAVELNGGALTGSPLLELSNSDLTIGGTSGDFSADLVFLNTIHGSQLAAGRQLRLSSGVTTFSAPVFTNQGTIQLDADGQIVRLNADQFQNDGLLELFGTNLGVVEAELHNRGTVVHDASSVLHRIGRAGAQHSNRGTLIVHDNRLQVTGDSFANEPDGRIEGTGTFDVANLSTARLDNLGTIAPGLSPEILTIQGDYMQSSTGTLEIEIGGLTPGSDGHDQLVVTGAATLAGRLDVSLINDFSPAVDDEVTYLTAASIAGQFETVFFQDPPEFRALELVYDATAARIRFVEPVPLSYDPTSGGGVWSNPDIWLGQIVPDSDNQATLSNSSAVGQEVTLDGNVIVHTLTIGGPSEQMTLSLPSGTQLSATHGVTVAQGGTVLLDGALFADTVDVESGGALGGDGRIVGKATNSGLLTPGQSPGQLTVEGDFEQSSSGVFSVELGGTATEDFDRLTVAGQAVLGGTLDVSLIEMFEPTPGDRFPILSAADGIVGLFETASLPESDLFTWRIDYGTTQVDLWYDFISPDFDGDGDVDDGDLMIWQDGFGIMDGADKGDGDADGDGDVDGDDFLVWQRQFGQGQGELFAHVPEPATATLLVVTIGLLGCFIRSLSGGH